MDEAAEEVVEVTGYFSPCFNTRQKGFAASSLT